jgi:hypothetical protein
MNRRDLLYCLSFLSVSSLAASQLFSEESSQRPYGEHYNDERSYKNAQPSARQLSVGILGVVGVGTYHLDRVAQSLNFPCKTIAVETDKDRLRSCHAQHALFDR